MKRHFINRTIAFAAAMTLAAVAASAQNNDDIDPMFSYNDRLENLGPEFLKPEMKKSIVVHRDSKFCDEGISGFEIGTTMGMNVVPPMGVATAFGSDFRIPLVSGSYRPFRNGFRIAGDVAVGKSATRLYGGDQFLMVGDKLSVVPFQTGVTKKKSIVRNGVLSSSLLAGLSIGHYVELYGGVEGDFNFSGTAINKYKGKDANGNKKVKMNDVKTNTFTFAYKAGFFIDDIGFYFKYSPCKALENGMGPQWERCAFGIVIR